jgi:hypothetical protein
VSAAFRCFPLSQKYSRKCPDLDMEFRNCSIFELMRHEVDIEADVEEEDVDHEFNGRGSDCCDNRRPWSPHGGYVSDRESCVGSGDFGSAVAAPAEFRVKQTYLLFLGAF